MEDARARAVVEAIYAAYAEGDVDRLRTLLADDLRWRQAAVGVPAAGAEVVGAEALIDRVVRPLNEDWDGFTEEVDTLVAADGHVVATGTYRGTYRPTGRPVTAEFCHLWTVRDGRARTFRQFTDTAAFVAATA